MTYPLLCRKCHLSPSSVSRRFTALSSSLAAYHLSLSRNQFPLLQGNEIQIRFFHYQLLRWMFPDSIKSPSDAFFCLKTIHEKRKASYPLENGIEMATVFPKHFVPAYYLRHEHNYLFLWKQLFGLEAFYLPDEDTYLLNQLFAAELFKERLGSVSFQTCLVKITQIHLLCALLEGNLILFTPNRSLSHNTLTLVRLFLSQLPHYDQLLKKHPELPLLYEMIWHNSTVLLDWNKKKSCDRSIKQTT